MRAVFEQDVSAIFHRSGVGCLTDEKLQEVSDSGRSIKEEEPHSSGCR